MMTSSLYLNVLEYIYIYIVLQGVLLNLDEDEFSVYECVSYISIFIVLQDVPMNLDEDEFSVHEYTGIYILYCRVYPWT